MKIIFNSLHKIDIENNLVEFMPHSSDKNDLDGYVMELVTNILSGSDRKGYHFRSDSTEVRTLLTEILDNNKTDEKHYDTLSQKISKRLLTMEKSSQAKVDKLGIEILKGVLVVSLIEFDDKTSKIIISKADHNDFIDSITFRRTSGLPIRKKIYKAFISEFNDKRELTRTSVYDTNSVFSVYWWRDFLELTEVYTDEHNTETAFAVLNSRILAPLKTSSKADYINLWNTTVHYFRTKKEFALEDYIDNVIKEYRPFNDKIDINDIEKKRGNYLKRANLIVDFRLYPIC
ncbi:hypothetical protein INP83_05475 [Mucilaginibacter sp. 21P]|uniref:nucleoid-associated protein n=1 Tax=Mucilaginibacter sp. 21P TaxID=2778902 RepID=UPI001C584C86|nr:nucleoid-associated protein [Mucilaginibacter sp. 21P]QXV66535.1 hypothetical protein INP83_05475 [Mucilaginibacter sp. 21P]